MSFYSSCAGALLVSLALSASTAAAQAVRRPDLGSHVQPRPKVLLIGIDGCRPDALLTAATPNLDGLIGAGALGQEFQAVLPTSSGPNWSSILTGVPPIKHGVVDNSFTGSDFASYPHFFTRAKEVRPQLFTASFVHWTPIHTEIVSGADISLGNLSDAQVAAQAASLLSGSAQPDVIFLHFDDVDGAGHSTGFSTSSPSYLAAIETTDSHIGTVLSALDARLAGIRGKAEDWLVLVSTDHGGLGTSHGGSSSEERTIFLIAAGSRVPAGTTLPPGNIYDIPVTALAHLGIDPQPSWDLDGVSVLDSIGCPSSFHARANVLAGSVKLTWSPGTHGTISGYEVLRNGASVALLPASAAGYTDVPNLVGAFGHPVFRYELQTIGHSGCALPAATVVLSSGDVRLADDFEDYPDDADLSTAGWLPIDEASPLENSTWSVENPGARATPPGFDGQPSAGRFVISDSDWGGSASNQNTPGSGMSHDLWSPVFDCSGLSEVWLHMSVNAQLNNNGEAVFDIDASDDGGSSWTNVFRRVAPTRSVAPLPSVLNADGYFGRLDVDLSAVAAGSSTARFRLRHFEPSWDWWVAVDDVVVDDVDLSAGGSVVLLSTTSFAAGIPAGWSLSGLNSGTETWHTTDKGGRYQAGVVGGQTINRLAHPSASPDFAILDSDADPDPLEDEALITPAVDCSSMARVFLRFDSEILFDAGATCEVLLSLDGGASFEPAALFTYSNLALSEGGEEPYFARRVLSVPAAAGQSNVAFAFRYRSPGNRWWWAIDQVEIRADP